MFKNQGVAMEIQLPSEEYVLKAFTIARRALGIEQFDEGLRDLVIYEMTDGMRTSTRLEGDNAYFDGGIFCLRFIHMLKMLGLSACYVNVLEEIHTHRDNYTHIFEGLKKLYPIFEEYAREQNIRLVFLGNLNGSDGLER